MVINDYCYVACWWWLEFLNKHSFHSPRRVGTDNFVHRQCGDFIATSGGFRASGNDVTRRWTERETIAVRLIKFER